VNRLFQQPARTNLFRRARFRLGRRRLHRTCTNRPLCRTKDFPRLKPKLDGNFSLRTSGSPEDHGDARQLVRLVPGAFAAARLPGRMRIGLSSSVVIPCEQHRRSPRKEQHCQHVAHLPKAHRPNLWVGARPLDAVSRTDCSRSHPGSLRRSPRCACHCRKRSVVGEAASAVKKGLNACRGQPEFLSQRKRQNPISGR
jgi:hypothetical protein